MNEKIILIILLLFLYSNAQVLIPKTQNYKFDVSLEDIRNNILIVGNSSYKALLERTLKLTKQQLALFT